MKPAKAMAYAFTTHCRPCSPSASPLRMDGRATFTTEMSRTTRNCPAQASATTSQTGGAAGADLRAVSVVSSMYAMLSTRPRPGIGFSSCSALGPRSRAPPAVPVGRGGGRLRRSGARRSHAVAAAGVPVVLLPGPARDESGQSQQAEQAPQSAVAAAAVVVVVVVLCLDDRGGGRLGR